ncbi:MAG: peptide deformylase [wastewater metagenome]|nr:peptide deformylase [Candidatus Loosdrechtia aerotolerans]
MNIITYPEPVLRQKAKPLTEINKKVYEKVEEMMALMYRASGIGLAAPQVGWSVRLFIIDVTGGKYEDKVFINPTTVGEEGELNKEEGCLSLPGITGKVIRAQKIRGHAYNLKGQKIEIEVEDLAARAWQHEMDHLNGTLFIDKVSPATRLALSHQLKEFERSYRDKSVKVSV